MNTIINEYQINLKSGETLRLKKGMSKQEVISILGNPFKVESCKNQSNEKLIFKINSSLKLTDTSYTILFTRQELVYVAKLI